MAVVGAVDDSRIKNTDEKRKNPISREIQQIYGVELSVVNVLRCLKNDGRLALEYQ